MSLEEALNRNSDLLEKHNALLEKVLAGGKATPAAPAAKPAAEKPASKPAAAKPAAAAAKKTPSAAVVSQRFADYMKGGGDETAREAAIANVRSLVQHYQAPKLTEIDAKHFPRLLEYLDAWEAGEEVEFDALEDDEEDEDGEGGGGESLL